MVNAWLTIIIIPLQPSGHEKSPIRHQIIEISKLKKMLKGMNLDNVAIILYIINVDTYMYVAFLAMHA